MRFIDTNVPIYAVSTAAEESEKRRRALEVLARPDLALSVQVLQEFYVQATRSSRPGALSHDAAISFIETLKRFPVQAVTLELMQAAFDIRERFGLSYWDSAILAAAGLQGCSIVYSEDLSSEQDYGGIRVVNPFIEASASSV